MKKVKRQVVKQEMDLKLERAIYYKVLTPFLYVKCLIMKRVFSETVMQTLDFIFLKISKNFERGRLVD